MMPPMPKCLALAGGLVMFACIARAGPPLDTDDPETLAKGHFELNTAYTLNLSGRDGDAGRTWTHELPHVDLSYGLFEGVQIKAEGPLVLLIDPIDRTGPRAGAGDASIGAKIRFFREDEAPVSVSIFPAIGIPLGSRARGLGTGSPSLTFPMEIGRHFLDDKLFLYADGGYQEQFAEGEGDIWFFGLAAEYEIVEGLILCAELRHEFGVRGAPDDSLFNVGVKYTLTENAAFIGAIGRSFNPSADAGADLRLYVGIQWSF
jgi:hypothetical protein